MHDLENLTQEITVKVDPITAMAIIGNIQLATRHPNNNGPSRKMAERFARMLQQRLIELRPAYSELLNKGWNPEFDVE